MTAATLASEAHAPTVVQKKTSEEKVAKKERTKPTHPKTSEMVTAAIKGLKERGGSSLQAIKKYIALNYKVDAEKLAPFIRKYLKAAVTSGALVQTKGKGASGSFKLAAPTAKPVEKKVKKEGKKEKVEGSLAKPKAKVAATVKKPAKMSDSSKKVKAKPKEKMAAGVGSPSKVKKAAKVPTKKPKAPKPKKAKATA